MGRRKKGIALVLVLSVAAILLILAIAIFIQSNVAVKTSQYQEALSLAETASESARGWAEMQTNTGQPLPFQTDSSALSTGSTALYYTTGGQVKFESQAVAGTNAAGIPFTAPAYDTSGTFQGLEQIGYFAYILKGGPPTEIFALGAVGTSANSIQYVREIHVLIQPVSYSQYTFFDANPNDVVAIGDQSRDMITNDKMTASCSPPCSGATLYNANTDIPGGNSYLSFHKEYMAGQMAVLPPGNSNNELVGMNQGDYYFTLNDSQNAVEALQPTYVPPGGNSGIWTNQQGIGLPKGSGNGSLSNVMQALFNNARQGGLFLYDPGSWMVNSSTNIQSNNPTQWNWIPQNNWDPQTNYSSLNNSDSNNKVNITLNSGGQTCSDGSTGDIMVQVTDQYVEYYFNGVHGVIYNGSNGAPYASHCFNSASLQNKIVYTDGNMGIQADPTSGYAGSLSYVSPGKITVNGNLASKSFTIDNSTTPPTFSSSASDVSALITPYQIDLSPPNTSADGFKSTMVLEQIGSPASLPSAWSSAVPNLNNPSNFTIQVSGPAYGSGSSYNNIYLYGTQIQYTRSGNWYNYYTNVYEPFDANLLNTQPPYTPILSAGYNVVSWREVNRTSHQDMTYSSP